MFGNSCTGCIQVPTPVYYWGPYAFPTTFGKKSFQITDLIQASQEYHKTHPGAGLAVNGPHPAESAHNPTNKPNIRTYHGKPSEDSGKRLHTGTLTFGFRSRLSDSDSEMSEAINYSTKLDTNIKCSVPSALEPLQALCSSDLRGYEEHGSASLRKRTSSGNDRSAMLKFGMNRILSDDFGKEDERKNGKENTKTTESHRPCECTFDGCRIYQNIRFPSHALTAVHALQPPKYPPAPTGSDTLPGPYSVLNTEVNIGSQSKRKRSWSRAVFSNLQRKGLEKRFEVQKYVTKPDRRQLAAMLGLTDAQVKVWFQNRRMKWRHAQQCTQADSEIDSSELSQNDQTGNDVTDEPEVAPCDYTSLHADEDSDSMDEMEDMNIVVVTEDEAIQQDIDIEDETNIKMGHKSGGI